MTGHVSCIVLKIVVIPVSSTAAQFSFTPFDENPEMSSEPEKPEDSFPVY